MWYRTWYYEDLKNGVKKVFFNKYGKIMLLAIAMLWILNEMNFTYYIGRYICDPEHNYTVSYGLVGRYDITEEMVEEYFESYRYITLPCSAVPTLEISYYDINQKIEFAIEWFGATVGAYQESSVYLYAGLLLIYYLARCFVIKPVQIGRLRYMMNLREDSEGILDLFYGYKKNNYVKVILLIIFKDILMGYGVVSLLIYFFLVTEIVFRPLWAILILGILILREWFKLKYFALDYIMAENSELKLKRIFEICEKMTYGEKTKIFLLNLKLLLYKIIGSFCSIFTLGIISIFVVNPYIDFIYCELFSELRMKVLETDVCTTNELNKFEQKREMFRF